MAAGSSSVALELAINHRRRLLTGDCGETALRILQTDLPALLFPRYPTFSPSISRNGRPAGRGATSAAHSRLLEALIT